MKKKRVYRFDTKDGRAPFDRARERAINKRLSEELNRPASAKPATAK